MHEEMTRKCLWQVLVRNHDGKLFFFFFQCQHIPGGGLRAGSYNCVCRPGYYFPTPNATNRFFSGITMENSFLDDFNNKSAFNSSNFQCLPCLPGCHVCEDKTPCMAEYNILLRGIPLGIQSFCITVSLVIGVAVLRLRKTKVSSQFYTLFEDVVIWEIIGFKWSNDLHFLQKGLKIPRV
jgi:G protein-coupled receptor 158